MVFFENANKAVFKWLLSIYAVVELFCKQAVSTYSVSLVLLPGMLEREEAEVVGKGKLRSRWSCNSPPVTLGKSFQRCSPPRFSFVCSG